MCIFMLLQACQPLQQATCESGGQQSRCAEDTPKEQPVKPSKYANQFTVDPHAWHKSHLSVVNRLSDHQQRVVKFSANDANYKYRDYVHSVISPAEHEPRVTRYSEKKHRARSRTGNLQFDALFALAMDELENSYISRTSDVDYSSGKSVSCDCFGDRKSQNFLPVDTLSLAGMLGLSSIDANRLKNSLLFNISPYRGGIQKPDRVPGETHGLQLVQRAAHHGSWPVENSRILWVLAAESALHMLAEENRKPFIQEVYKALKNTIEIDRVAIFDGRDGLYFGAHQLNANVQEREGLSKALSKTLTVNLAYYHSLIFASRLAELQRDVVSSVKYLDWAVDLKNAINLTFWDSQKGVYLSALSKEGENAGEGTNEGKAPAYFWEQALAILLNVPEKSQIKKIAQWDASLMDVIDPFTAGILLGAATKIENISLVDDMYRVLIDSASGRMSNIHYNIDEVQTEDIKAISAYISMVYENLFGITPEFDGLSFRPFLTAKLRRTQFKQQNSIALFDVKIRDAAFDIRVMLPAIQGSSAGEGVYSVNSIRVNGEEYTGSIPWDKLAKHNRVIIKLGRLKKIDKRYIPFPENFLVEEKTPQKSFASTTVLDLSRVPAKKSDILRHDFSVVDKGIYRIDFKYRYAKSIEKGIHNAVKWVGIYDGNGNELITKVIVFPLQGKHNTGSLFSTALDISLAPSAYTIRMEDFMNMTYLHANMSYTGIGGRRGPSNTVPIGGIRIRRLIE